MPYFGKSSVVSLNQVNSDINSLRLSGAGWVPKYTFQSPKASGGLYLIALYGDSPYLLLATTANGNMVVTKLFGDSALNFTTAGLLVTFVKTDNTLFNASVLTLN